MDLVMPTKEYYAKMSPEQKQKAHEDYKAWKKANPDKIKIYKKAYRKRHPDKIASAAKRTKIRHKMEHKGSVMLNCARNRAKRLGVPFELKLEDIVIPKYCPITGVELWSGNRTTSGSIDRIIPELGYIKGNIGVISMGVNQLKGRLTVDEVGKLYEYMKRLKNG